MEKVKQHTLSPAGLVRHVTTWQRSAMPPKANNRGIYIYPNKKGPLEKTLQPLEAT